MHRLYSTLITIAIATSAMAQYPIRGSLVEASTKKPLGFANVRLTTEGDSTFVGGATTDVDGGFTLSSIKPGRYVLTISMVGFRPAVQHINMGKSVLKLPTIRLYDDATTLGEVTVTGMRSAMKLEVDRKTFDVSQLITNSGQAATDILDNIPSVEVDNDGNVSLRGNTSVEIWINGKANGLTADNRSQILQQIPAESIERIEVIDNPSAKFSAEGSAGIINIILKKGIKPGYYGSVALGGDTRGGANTNGSINYNSGHLDANFNIGLRHRANQGYTESEQLFSATSTYQRYHAKRTDMGNSLFARGGLTWHITGKDDLSFTGMLMRGLMRSWNTTPYHYGRLNDATDSRIMTRATSTRGKMAMLSGELGFKHSFTEKHFVELNINTHSWQGDNDNFFRDSTLFIVPQQPTEYSYLSRPLYVRNRSWQAKVDYENAFTDKIKLQAGYQGDFSKENTPQESFQDNRWDGATATEDPTYYNRFIYKLDIHALYTSITWQLGKLGVMAGLRGEYWRVNTESYDYRQEHDASLRNAPFKKSQLQLFPSLFLSYELPHNQQLQLNYTKRLRRPWGGQLNSFRNTSDATTVSFGNPQLTPEYSHSFAMNYLKTWDKHSLLVSAYYRPTTDVMQRVTYRNATDGLMYTTTMNLANSQSSGVEATLKNRFFNILELTSNLNFYDYRLNSFNYAIDNQTVSGGGNHSFTWNAHVTASLTLPADISVQLGGRYRSKQIFPQGYRKPNYSMDLGIRKNFFDRKLTVALSCRDLLDSRKFETFTEGADFTRHQLNRRGSRKVNLTLTWSFGNNKPTKNHNEPQHQEEEGDQYGQGMD